MSEFSEPFCCKFQVHTASLGRSPYICKILELSKYRRTYEGRIGLRPIRDRLGLVGLDIRAIPAHVQRTVNSNDTVRLFLGYPPSRIHSTNCQNVSANRLINMMPVRFSSSPKRIMVKGRTVPDAMAIALGGVAIGSMKA